MANITKSSIRSFAIVAVVAVAAYFIHVEYQTRLGQKAIDATGLELHTLDDALAKSKESGKPVLADLSAIWCPSCRRLDTEVLANEAVRTKIESDYIFARIEYESDEGAAFMERHNLRGFPNLLILDANGNKLKDVPVTFSPSAFLARL